MPLPPSMISLSRLFACPMPEPDSAVSPTTVLVLARPALHFHSSSTEHFLKSSQTDMLFGYTLRPAVDTVKWIGHLLVKPVRVPFHHNLQILC